MSRHRDVRNAHKQYVDDYYDDYDDENYDDEYDPDLQGYITGSTQELSEADKIYYAELESSIEHVSEVFGPKTSLTRKEISNALEECELDIESATEVLLKLNDEKKKKEKQQKKKQEKPLLKQPSQSKKHTNNNSNSNDHANKNNENPSMKKSKSSELAKNSLQIDLSGLGMDSESAHVSRTPSPTFASNPMVKIPKAKKKGRIDVLEEFNKRKQDEKEHLQLVVIGHVDAGKSTLMGHLLYDLGAVAQNTIHKFEREAQKIGKGSFAYAWVLDETSEERTRGVTMDIAVRHFETPKKRITLLDAPGHRDFIPNMIMGATQADVAMLVANATTNEFEAGFHAGGQTREHAVLARSLGVTQLIVAVNKMDTVDYSKERYDAIVAKLKTFLRKNGFKESNLLFVPCSGFTGENLVNSSEELLKQWFKGPTIVEAIDLLRSPSRPVERPLRICISDIYKNNGVLMAGNVISGSVTVDDQVVLMPGSEFGSIKSIVSRECDSANWAVAGDMIDFSVSDIDMSHVRVGSFLCDVQQPMVVATRIRAQIVVFQVDVPIIKGFPVVLHFQMINESGNISKLVQTLDRTSGEILKKRPRALSKDTTAIVEITLNRSICLDATMRNLSRFTLRNKGHTIAAGVLEEVLE